MTDKVYIQQPEEQLVPVTVRISWLGCGTIKPLMYWTPDGSCYVVEKIYEKVSLASVKNKGEGIRFKVKAVIKEGPEHYRDCHHVTRHETYLYFADNFFNGKNFIDDRYGHEGKEFIPVNLDVFPNGGYEIISFEVLGNRYVVDKTLETEFAGSFNAGGIGIRHKVEAWQTDSEGNNIPLKSVIETRVLFLEVNKWYVAVRSAWAA